MMRQIIDSLSTLGLMINARIVSVGVGVGVGSDSEVTVKSGPLKFPYSEYTFTVYSPTGQEESSQPVNKFISAVISVSLFILKLLQVVEKPVISLSIAHAIADSFIKFVPVIVTGTYEEVLLPVFGVMLSTVISTAETVSGNTSNITTIINMRRSVLMLFPRQQDTDKEQDYNDRSKV
jgi:hypothetical protein